MVEILSLSNNQQHLIVACMRGLGRVTGVRDWMLIDIGGDILISALPERLQEHRIADIAADIALIGKQYSRMFQLGDVVEVSVRYRPHSEDDTESVLLRSIETLAILIMVMPRNEAPRFRANLDLATDYIRAVLQGDAPPDVEWVV